MTGITETNPSNSTADRPDPTDQPQRRRRAPRWVVPLLAVAGALAVWFIGVAAGVGDVIVDTGQLQQVDLPTVAAASLVIGLAGWGTRALIGKIDRNAVRAQRIWLLLSGGVLLVSLTGVMGAVTTAAMLVLLAEHVVVGLIIMLGLRR